MLLVFSLSFTPRSPRWLFTHGRIDEGKEVIKYLAKKNKRPEPNFEDLNEIIEAEKEKEKSNKSFSYITLFTSPLIRKKLFLLGFTWYLLLDISKDYVR